MAELKFNPGFRVIGKYLNEIDSLLKVNLNWLSIWIDSRVKLTQYWESIYWESAIIDIESPPVTQFFRSKWLHFFIQCYLHSKIHANSWKDNNHSNFIVMNRHWRSKDRRQIQVLQNTLWSKIKSQSICKKRQWKT